MKNALSIIALLLMCLYVTAQDRIVLKDGYVMLAKVNAITDLDLHYYRVLTDEKGQYYPDERTVHVISLEKVESVTLASGRKIYQSGESHQETAIRQATNPNIVPQYKNPAVAYLFSTIPGVGQFYNDEVDKGFSFIAATLAESLIFSISVSNLTRMETYTYSDDTYPYAQHTSEREVTNQIAVGGAFLSGVAFFVTYLWSSIDAVTTANKLNIEHGYLLSVSPTLSCNTLSLKGTNALSAGLSLSLSF